MNREKAKIMSQNNSNGLVRKMKDIVVVKQNETKKRDGTKDRKREDGKHDRQTGRQKCRKKARYKTR